MKTLLVRLAVFRELARSLRVRMVRPERALQLLERMRRGGARRFRLALSDQSAGLGKIGAADFA